MPNSVASNANSRRLDCNPGRRQFIAGLAALPFLELLPLSANAESGSGLTNRTRALLVSATTLAGHMSLEHAEEELRSLYEGVQRILLINFASLPADRDAYAARMQRDFSRIDKRFKVDSLHFSSAGDAAEVVRGSEAVYVSGGNTFLLLKELYDREVVGLLRRRVLQGLPYSGSSAGSNIGGSEIGTTNDFPLVDVPTRRSLGLMAACYNPHHPDRAQEQEYNSRQYKIRQYCRYHPNTPVIGVNNAGMISVQGGTLSLRGESAEATIQLGAHSEFLANQEDGNISRAIAELIQKIGKTAS